MSAKYPKAVFFIVVNEFCERFTFYGLRTVLSLYFATVLGYSEGTSTVMFHVFAMLCYFFPLFGGLIADVWLGKFKTILYLSIIYAGGSFLLTLASTDVMGVNVESILSFLGLLFIAIGTGGIKPCVSSFGGDQFQLPEQRDKLAKFFSIFYFAINSGSLISTFITPFFRQDVHCLGRESCYPLAFGVPAMIMVVGIVIFVVGKRLYKYVPPRGNVLLRVCACIGSALSGRRKRKVAGSDMRWVDYADQSKYDQELRDDVVIVLRVLALFLPLPVFWALIDQQGSRWTFQAVNMNGRIGPYIIKPDQMQVVNPVLILVFLPIMVHLVYPCLARIRLIRRPLQKMVCGGILASTSFFISAILEKQLESTYPAPLSKDLAQLRIFNVAPCPLTLSSNQFGPITVAEMDMHVELALKAISGTSLNLQVSGTCLTANTTHNIPLKSKTAQSVYLFADSRKSVLVEAPTPDTVERTSNVDPRVRFVYSFPDGKDHKIELQSGERTEFSYSVPAGEKFNASGESKGVPVRTYDLKVDDKVVLSGIFLDVSGTYSMLVTDKYSKVNVVMKPSQIFILWQLPQLAVITLGEVMFSVTGLEFAFTQAPVSMKSVLTSAWLLTVAVGNLIVVIIAEAKLFKSHVWEFILFACLMLVDMGIFIILAVMYKYRDESGSANAANAADVPSAASAANAEGAANSDTAQNNVTSETTVTKKKGDAKK